MPSPLPPWLQSNRGMLIAGALLALLLIAVPGLVATDRAGRDEDRAPPRGGRTAAEPAPAPSDPFESQGEDWLGEPPPVADGTPTQPAIEGALDCLILPSRTVEIGSQTIGLVERIRVERGERVDAGQVVVDLESGLETAAVDVARLRAKLEGNLRAREESLALSRSRKKRAAELYQKSALSEDTREELETQARIAELELLEAREARQLAALELQQAEALLARRTLETPISGIVTERVVEEGEVVDEETVILKIAKIDPLRADVLMPASRYGTIHPGMRATVQPEFPGDPSVVATVSIVDPVIDAASSTFSVRLDLPNADGLLPGGLHCAVKFLPE